MDGKKKELDTGIQFFQIESFAVNFIFIDTGDECNAGFFEVYLSGKVEDALYKSRLCTKMHLWPGVSALLKSSGIGRIIGQIGETCTGERRSADVFLYKRDMYTSRAAQTSQGKPKADFMKFIILIYDFRKIGIIFVNGHCKTKTTTI